MAEEVAQFLWIMSTVLDQSPGFGIASTLLTAMAALTVMMSTFIVSLVSS